MTKLLFVCLGNICRSPAAEDIMREMIRKAGAAEKVKCDSCGTSAYHIGAPADSRMQAHAQKRGYELTSLSRPFNDLKDFERFDYIFVMDPQNYDDVTAMAPTKKHLQKVKRMTDFCTEMTADYVPDPYYGGDAGFEKVLNILEDACSGVLEMLKRENRI